MSIEIIKTQIGKFLKTDAPEVMAIKGAWGVGKTFTWNKYLSDIKSSIKLNKYSYVSLFGVNSLDDLKRAIFIGVIPKKLIGDDLGRFKHIDKKITSLIRKRGWEFLRDLPVIREFRPTIQSVAFDSLNKTIICIDDFERKGKSLDAQDIMGLVTLLKEQKQCKVVLILNEELLENPAEIDYKKYREKVIDIELIFNPTASECADIALPSNNELSGKLKPFIGKLGINNIRIIKKIERLANIISPHLKTSENEVLWQALQSLVLFTWCFYDKSKSTPDFEFVKKFNGYSIALKGGKEQADDGERRMAALLLRYDYRNTDELDLQIASVVEHGFVSDENSLIEEVRKVNEQIISSKSKDSFRNAWDKFYYSFANNEEEVVTGLTKSFETNIKHIGIVDLDAMVGLFRKLKKEPLADRMIDEYIKERQGEKKLFFLEEHPLRGSITDEVLIRKFAVAYESQREERTITIEDILKKIIDKQSWNNGDIKILSDASSDDYYILFKRTKGEDLKNYITACLQWFNNDSNRQYQQISNNVISALKKIGKGSVLNALRVRRFGINPDSGLDEQKGNKKN